MNRSARAAWAFVSHNYQPNTGLVVAHENYQHVTMWDIASTLAAYYSARELGYVTNAEYQSRMKRALQTLHDMPMFEDSAFNKLYDAKSGAMTGRDQERSHVGYGWSAIDLGRLLVWLKLVGNRDPVVAPMTQQIVARLVMPALVQDGYLQGRDADPKSGAISSYQEGRLGYEQYAAEGFALWGASAANALDFKVNGKPLTIDGYNVLADQRGSDLLTSEPFVMMGLELGWHTADWRNDARLVYDAQKQRYDRTGTVTMLSEDALPDPPAYFYYYLLYRDGHTFVVTAPTGEAAPESVRWISAKAAFGWHTLLPSAYTWTALQAVRNAASANRGWTAGVYERSKQSTAVFNLNTAAIVLESALYSRRGCAFIEPACPARGM